MKEKSQNNPTRLAKILQTTQAKGKGLKKENERYSSRQYSQAHSKKLNYTLPDDLPQESLNLQ